jgi:hypothetical protein
VHLKQLFENVYYVNIKNWVKNHYNLKVEFKTKPLYIKIKDKNPCIKSARHMKAQVNTTQKLKLKQTINKKIRIKPHANRTHGYDMMTNDNKENLR